MSWTSTPKCWQGLIDTYNNNTMARQFMYGMARCRQSQPTNNFFATQQLQQEREIQERESSSQVWASSTPKQTMWWWWWRRRTSAKSRIAPHKWIEQRLVLIHHVGKRFLSRGCCYN
ncbi:hypothetical protein CY35_11G026700 [Sphagnum magellanicum]|nr:hypothetical protein CY35_11G026700 [Sphagnum magellanicum]